MSVYVVQIVVLTGARIIENALKFLYTPVDFGLAARLAPRWPATDSNCAGRSKNFCVPSSSIGTRDYPMKIKIVIATCGKISRFVTED